MYFTIFIVIGIIAVAAIFMLLRKKPAPKERDSINLDNGKKEQFNPEKVSGMMPEEELSENKREKDKK